MRRDLKKTLFIGHKSSFETFFSKAQEAALVHFIDPKGAKGKEVPVAIETLLTAIKFLRELPVLDQQAPEERSKAYKIASEVIELKHAISQLEEERRTLRLEIARVEVFGQFSLEDIAYIEEKGNRTIQFFFAKKGLFQKSTLPEDLHYIASEHGLDYFISIAKTPQQHENMIEMRIDQELSSLKHRAEVVKNELYEKEETLKKYAKYEAFLHQALAFEHNNFELSSAQQCATDEMEGTLFAIEGWVPAHKKEELQKLLADVDVYATEIAVEEEEVVPTYLENSGAGRVGEDLVHIYDTPSNTDRDPSLWVLGAFALFFAMIINDAGYGLLFLLGALYFKFKNPSLKNGGLRVWKLAMILCSSCIVWGVLANGFFGMEFAPDSPAKKASLIHWIAKQKASYHLIQKDAVYQEWVEKYPTLADAKSGEEFLLGAAKETEKGTSYEMVDRFSDGIMMELALLAGIIHISLSFLRYLDRNWSGAGWVLAIIGSYMYFPLFLKAFSMLNYLGGFDREVIAQEGLYLIYIGLGLAVVLGVLNQKLMGLLEITNMIQIFADILSYLRLYALGLAGSIISATVNDLAGAVFSNFFLAGILLLILGHGLNIVLSIIGGVIHGLRLNFIEWYHYSFEGGGKLFSPLRKVEIE